MLEFDSRITFGRGLKETSVCVGLVVAGADGVELSSAERRGTAEVAAPAADKVARGLLYDPQVLEVVLADNVTEETLVFVGDAVGGADWVVGSRAALVRAFHFVSLVIAARPILPLCVGARPLVPVLLGDGHVGLAHGLVHDTLVAEQLLSLQTDEVDRRVAILVARVRFRSFRVVVGRNLEIT